MAAPLALNEALDLFEGSGLADTATDVGLVPFGANTSPLFLILKTVNPELSTADAASPDPRPVCQDTTRTPKPQFLSQSSSKPKRLDRI